MTDQIHQTVEKEHDVLARAETATVNVISPRDAKRAAYGALVGNVLEWYDYFLFNTAAALVFNVQFFVSDNAATASMASFATLAVGFLVRPLGGVLFGWLGDRVGRKAVLMITVIGIGVATGLIGVLPNFMSIGIAAPIFVVVLRMLQGLFIGGEWGGAMTLAVEHAPLKMRAAMAAIPQMGSPLATILSSGGFFLLALFLSQDSFDSWGWRVPFLAAIPLLLFALWLRSKLSESPVFQQVKDSGHKADAPISTVLRTSWRQMLIGMFAVILGTAGFYIVTSFIMNYGTRVLEIDKDVVLAATMIGAVFQLAAVVHAGKLGQRFGASKVIIWSGVAGALIAFPILMMVETTSTPLVIAAVVIGLVVLTYSFAAAGSILTGLFAPNVRLSGVSLTYNAANIMAGLTPLVSTALVPAAGEHWWPAAMILIFFSVTSSIAAWLAPKLSQKLEDFAH